MNKLLKDFRGMSSIDLDKKLSSLEEEYLHLRFNNVTGQLVDKSLLKKIRRDIARAKTVIKEKNLTPKENQQNG